MADPHQPTQREQLGNVGETLDQAFALLRDMQSEFRRFVDAVQGVPGISKGALREIREQQTSLENRFDALEKGLPGVIAQAVGNTSNRQFRQRFDKWGMALAGLVGGAIASVVQLLVHH